MYGTEKELGVCSCVASYSFSLCRSRRYGLNDVKDGVFTAEEARQRRAALRTERIIPVLPNHDAAADSEDGDDAKPANMCASNRC